MALEVWIKVQIAESVADWTVNEIYLGKMQIVLCAIPECLV